MNLTPRTVAAACLILSSMCGCARHDDAPPAAVKEAAKPADAESDHEGVQLTPAQVAHMGIATTPLKADLRAAESRGFGVVLSHESIAQSVAELETAAATERQSRAALDRSRRLSGTPGAMPSEFLESAERQSAVDHAASELARRRLSTILGQAPPWRQDKGDAILTALASGALKLVRVTFPADALGEADPRELRLSRVGAPVSSRVLRSDMLWRAPADAALPGRSYFATSKSPLSEGERLVAYAPQGEALEGVSVPAAALLVSNGSFWCYVEIKQGTFVRRPLNVSMPSAAGYFVSEGLMAGDRVVTNAAGQLLARELNPSSESDSD